MKWKYSCSALAMSMALAACDGSSAPAAPEATPSQSGVNAVSQAFALAMQNTEVRTSLRDAMRGSLVSEHKLVLQDYVGTPSGQLLVASAARAAGLSSQALLAEIARLPEMDFYVASRQQRLSWQGGDRVAVVATTHDNAAALPGFDTFGRRVEQRGREPMAGVDAVFVLHPAESKHLRVYPQAPTRGSVIQEGYDGEWAGSVTETDEHGNVTTTLYVDMVPGGRLPVSSEGARGALLPTGGPSFVTTTGPGVFLTAFVPAFNDGSGACEMLFRTIVERPVIGSTTTDHRASSVECPGNHAWESRFPPRGRRSSATTPVSGANINVIVMEEDSFFNDDYGVQSWAVGAFPDQAGIPKEYTPGTWLTIKWYGS